MMWLICFCWSGKTNEKYYSYIHFPFTIEEVENIEMYHYDTMSTSAEKKIVTETKDIENLYHTFEDLALPTQKEAEQTTEGLVTSFRFCLLDGSNYEIIYVSYGVEACQQDLCDATLNLTR